MNLMDVLYKGYTVPKAGGRLVTFGMGFGSSHYKPVTPEKERKYGMLSGKVERVLADMGTWMAVSEVAKVLGASAPSVRNAMMALVEGKRVQSRMSGKGTRTYRKI
jgi:hypothetical protein